MKWKLKVALYSLFILVVACKQTPPTDNHKSAVDSSSQDLSIRGNWIQLDILDSLGAGHKIYMPNNLTFSELRIAENPDSFYFDNGDLEEFSAKAIKQGANQYYVKDLCAFPHSAFYFSEGMMEYYDSAANKLHRYIKVDNTWSDSTHDMFELFGIINHTLFAGKYTIKEAKNSEVKFTQNQKIQGWNDFDSYEFGLNGDIASMSEEPLLIIHDTKGKNHVFCYTLEAEVLKLYQAINTECKDCKPFYERGKLKYSLINQKK